MIALSDHFFALAALVYLVSCLIFSAVRWFHTCPHPKSMHDLYYPDRKMGARFYLVALILLPYVVNPSDPEAWLLVRCYYLSSFFFYMSTLLLLFFGSFKQRARLRSGFYFMLTLVVVTLLALLAIALWPGLHLSVFATRAVEVWVTCVGLLTMGWCLRSMLLVKKWVKAISDANYSNPDDIPQGYAQTVQYLPVLLAVIVWTIFLANNPWVLAVCHVLLGVFNVFFLIYILRPRAMDNFMERMIADMEEAPYLPRKADEPDEPEDIITEPLAEKDTLGGMSPSVADEIEAEIVTYLVRERGYLDAHLKIENVVRRCSYSRAYVSRVFNDRFGGFYFYVNSLRLKHYDNYMSKHPHATKEAAAQESGFSSYQSYYKVRKRMDEA